MADTQQVHELKILHLVALRAGEAAAAALAAAAAKLEGEDARRFMALHFTGGMEPQFIALAARAEKQYRDHADALQRYRRAVIRLHGGVLPSVSSEDQGSIDDGEDRT